MVLQPEAEGSVRQALTVVMSEIVEVNEAGRVEDAEYVPVQPEAEGSVIHEDIDSTSLLRVVAAL